MSGATSNNFASTASRWDFKKYLKSPVSVNVTAVSITLGLFTWLGDEFECPCVDDGRRNAFAYLFMLTPALLLALLSSWAMYEMKRPKKNVKFGLMTFVLVFLTWVEVVLLDGKTVCCMENSYPVDFTCHLINASAAEREQQHESCTATSKVRGRPQRSAHLSFEGADGDVVEMEAMQGPVAERERGRADSGE